MATYIDDVFNELTKHHAIQSAAISAVNDLENRGDDYKTLTKTRLVDQAKNALSAFNCVECNRMASEFTGDKRP